MLSKLFLMRKRLLLLWKSYCYRTDLLQMLSKVFIMSNRIVTFVEGAVNAEQGVSHE